MGDATIQLGALTGVWRPVYARRQALHTAAEATVLAAWRADLAGLRIGPAVAAWHTAIGEAVDPEQQRRRDAAAAALLPALAARAWRRTLAALTLAVQQAHRAGWAAGHAIATQDDDDDSDFGEPDLSTLLVGQPGMPDRLVQVTAVSTLNAAVGAASRRAGAALADATDDPEAAVDGELDDGDDITLATDTAVSAAYGLGLIGAYTALGRTSVDLVTAGDGRVCARCEQAAAGGPYSPFAAPLLPLHPRCRCILTT